jgi:hypothetical protein
MVNIMASIVNEVGNTYDSGAYPEAATTEAMTARTAATLNCILTFGLISLERGLCGFEKVMSLRRGDGFLFKRVKLNESSKAGLKERKLIVDGEEKQKWEPEVFIYTRGFLLNLATKRDDGVFKVPCPDELP